jgi:hypothetical protein
MYRQIFCMLALSLAAGCQRSGGSVPIQVVDLLRELPRAEARPAAGFSAAIHEHDALVRPAIGAPVPSRLTVPLPLPRRGVLRAALAVGGDGASIVRFRVGVSDHRIYEGLEEVVLTGSDPGWFDLRADLSAYAGFKWSVFYRPDAITWRLVLAADSIGPSPARAFWGSPEIVTDAASAREYVGRRERLEADARQPGSD